MFSLITIAQASQYKCPLLLVHPSLYVCIAKQNEIGRI